MAKAPTPGRIHSPGANELSVKITIDGDAYTLYPNLLTADGVRAVREQTGSSVRKLITMAEDDPDIDIIAALVWVARCQAGDDVDFATVAAAISYETKLDIEELETEMDADHPL
jgi:hypothetical protein